MRAMMEEAGLEDARFVEDVPHLCAVGFMRMRR
jgi:hypothetical protein